MHKLKTSPETKNPKKSPLSWTPPAKKKFTTLKQEEQELFIFLLCRNFENASSKALQKPLSCPISMRDFPNWGFQLWNSGPPYKTTSLPYVQNNPQHNVDEILDSQALNQTGLNEKNSKETDTLKKKILHFLLFPLSSIIFLPSSYFI